VNFIKDEIQRYSEAPIKIFLSKAGIPAYADAGSHKAIAFSGDKVADALAHIKKQRAELESVMIKAFKAFDKDGSGYIDATELRSISKDMGRELDPSEVDECMKDLDIDKDNRISYQEFSKWWLSGR
jgi:EF-hand domain pair